MRLPLGDGEKGRAASSPKKLSGAGIGESQKEGNVVAQRRTVIVGDSAKPKCEGDITTER